MIKFQIYLTSIFYKAIKFHLISQNIYSKIRRQIKIFINIYLLGVGVHFGYIVFKEIATKIY